MQLKDFNEESEMPQLLFDTMPLVPWGRKIANRLVKGTLFSLCAG